MNDSLAVLVDSFGDPDGVRGWALLGTSFMRNAFLIGTLIAVASGAVGYFVLLRDLPFATHAVAHIGFPGATLAALIGLSPVSGLVAACVGGAGAIGVLSRRERDREVVTGTVLAFASGLGILFNSLGTGQSGTITSILFGNVLAVSVDQILVFAAIAVAALAVLAVIGRPLLFASVDPDVAAARGVPVAPLGAAFLVVMSVIVAGAVLIVGVLLIFALLVTPAAAAAKLTARPSRVILLATAIALASMWGGLIVAMFKPWPPSFLITTIACMTWLAASWVASRRKLGVGTA